MEWNLLFFFNSVLLGAGLAMDAFSVSLANGLNEPGMKTGRMCGVAGVYAVFQAVMPMIGWGCVHTILQYFRAFEKCIPWIALILLLHIGGKMLIEGLKHETDMEEEFRLGLGALNVSYTHLAALIGVKQPKCPDSIPWMNMIWPDSRLVSWNRRI